MNLVMTCFMQLRGSVGALSNFAGVANALDSLGHRVTVYLPRTGPVPKRFRCPVRMIPSSRLGRNRLTPYLDLLLYELLAPIYLAAQAMRRRPDAVYNRLSMLNVAVACTAWAFGIPLITAVNDYILGRIRPRPWNRTIARLHRVTERISYRLSKRIVTVTPQIKRVLCRDYGVPEAKIEVLPNAADADRLRPRPKTEARAALGLPPGDRLVTYIGDLTPNDGVGLLLKSACSIVKRHPEMRVLIVGDGVLRKDLRAFARQLGLADNVVFTGRVPHDRAITYVAAADVCAVPLPPRDTGVSPIKVAEYMACGRPIVGTRIANLDYIEESGAGLLVPPDDPEAYAEAIVTLLDDPARGEAMGRAGRHYAEAHLDWRQVARRIVEVACAP